MDKKSAKRKLIFTGYVVLLALQYPVLTFFSQQKEVFGVPLLYLYILLVWLLTIFWIFRQVGVTEQFYKRKNNG